jgi:hypothetical protein
LIHLWFKGEPFFLAVDVEADLSGSYSDVSIGSVQESFLRIRGILVSTSMLRTTKSTGTKKSWTLPECPLLSPPGCGPMDPLAASTLLLATRKYN